MRTAMLLEAKRQHMVCATCGSENVQADAFASWNFETQSWEIAQTFDKGSYCDDCDGECHIDEIDDGQAFASVEREDSEARFHGVVRKGGQIIARTADDYEFANEAHAAAEELLP